jgi:hypothetical protein
MHHAGATALSELLQFPAPAPEQRALPCACGHHERMSYREFRAQHLFVGSGVIEAGCKTVIGSRLKQSGMFSTVRRANAIIALRCCHLNGRFEDYGEARRAA